MSAVLYAFVEGAHPRGCGADALSKAVRDGMQGSSPRVRGRHTSTVGRVLRTGLIPAGAGQTSRARLRTQLPNGSSPRVRGRPLVVGVTSTGPGLIPAGAGQTKLSLWTGPALTAHPRGCGADMPPRALKVYAVGSSPRVRGRPPGAKSPQNVNGAHPRGCGADSSALYDSRACLGSSPRVRGRRVCAPPPQSSWRLIPAGAGQTGALISIFAD